MFPIALETLSLLVSHVTDPLWASQPEPLL